MTSHVAVDLSVQLGAFGKRANIVASAQADDLIALPNVSSVALAHCNVTVDAGWHRRFRDRREKGMKGHETETRLA